MWICFIRQTHLNNERYNEIAILTLIQNERKNAKEINFNNLKSNSPD
jgi:hypothetical protein